MQQLSYQLSNKNNIEYILWSKAILHIIFNNTSKVQNHKMTSAWLGKTYIPLYTRCLKGRRHRAGCCGRHGFNVLLQCHAVVSYFSCVHLLQIAQTCSSMFKQYQTINDSAPAAFILLLSNECYTHQITSCWITLSHAESCWDMLRLPHAGKAQLQFNIATLNLSTLFAMSSDFTTPPQCWTKWATSSSLKSQGPHGDFLKHLETSRSIPKIS